MSCIISFDRPVFNWNSYTDAMGKAVEHGVQLAEWAEDEVKKHEHWEVVSPAQLAITNFRYVPPGYSDLQIDLLNKQISQEMVKDGFALVLTTQLHGKTVLRICAINPESTEEDIRNTVRRLSKYALELVEISSTTAIAENKRK